jgi:hypothetical protein
MEWEQNFIILSGSKVWQKDEKNIAHSSNAQRQNRKTESRGKKSNLKEINEYRKRKSNITTSRRS